MNTTYLRPLALAAALTMGLAACKQNSPPPADVAAPPAATAEAAAPAIEAQSGTYTLDPTHTIVLAQWNHMGFSNPSLNFANGHGQLVYDAANPSASSVQVTLPLSGITSFTPDFDTHLASGDFFDSAKFPEATFKSTSVTANGGNKFTVVGDLTIKGIAKPVTLDVTLNGAGAHPMTKAQTIGFDATGTVKRSDWGLDYATPVVSDEVTLRITTEASIAAGSEAAASAAAAEPATAADAPTVAPEEAAGNPYATPAPATEAPVQN